MRKLTLALAVVAAIAVVVLIALGGSGDDDAPAARAAIEPPRVEGVRRCRERVEGGPSGTGAPSTGPDDVRVGPVTFFGLGRAARARRSQFEPLPNGHDQSWKAGITVTAGPPVVLVVDDALERGITLQYDRRSFDGGRVTEGGGDPAVRVEPCPPATPSFSGGRVGPYTAFAGGFLLGRRACVTVQVFRSGRVWSRPVSFGTRGRGCPAA